MKLHLLLLGIFLVAITAQSQTKTDRAINAYYLRTIDVLTTTATNNLGAADNEEKFTASMGAITEAVSATDETLNKAKILYQVNRTYVPELDAADNENEYVNSTALNNWVDSNGLPNKTYMLSSQSPHYTGYTATPGVEEASTGASGYASLKVILHELGHMLGGVHADGLTGISGDIYLLNPDGTETFVGTNSDLETIMQNGIPGGTDLEVFGTSAANNIGNPTHGGNGFWSRNFTQSGNNYRIDIPIAGLESPNNNVSDMFRADFINNPDKYEIVSVDPNIISPAPNIQIIDGKFKLVNATELTDVIIASKTTDTNYQNLYFYSGNHLIFPYEYGFSNDGSQLNEGYSIQQLIDGIPTSSLSSGTKEFRTYEQISNSLGASGGAVLSINNFEKNIELSIYPNPITNGIINILANENINSVEIYNLLGQVVFKQKLNINNTTANIENLDSGVYTLKAFSQNGIGIKQIIKR